MATMASKIKKALNPQEDIERVTVKKGKKAYEIADNKLAEIIRSARKTNIELSALKETYEEFKRYIINIARDNIEDEGTVTFITEEGIECKVTFGYDCIIPEEHVEEARKILGDKFEALVRIKTKYEGTSKLIEFATDADKGGEIAKYVVVKEKPPQISFKK